MKKYIVTIFFALIQLTLFSQNEISGDFEEWFCYPPLAFPNGWTNSVFEIACISPELAADKTTDNYEGSLAVKMESSICVDPFGENRLQAGFIFTAASDTGYDPLWWSVPYSSRPEELSFHYKFHQEGIDSAAIYLLLFNHDTQGNNIDTIAVASGYIDEEVTEYTELILPIEYYSEDIPSFAHIFFICSKTIGDLGQVTYTPAHEINASAGTTLWVDDVVLRSSTVNTTSPQEESWNFNIYPNPVDAEIYIDIPQQIQVDKIQIYDNQGRVVKGSTMFNNILNMSDISKGIYYLKLETNKGIRFKKVIKK